MKWNTGDDGSWGILDYVYWSVLLGFLVSLFVGTFFGYTKWVWQK